MTTIPLKMRKQLVEALHITSLAVLHEHFPGWDQATPETMSAEQQKLLQVIADFEQVAAFKITQLLT